MIDSTLTIHVDAPPERVFALVADVEQWPRHLPHYRWVRRLRAEGARRTLEMAAWRGLPGLRGRGYPVRWTAVVEPDPAAKVLRFTHIGGPTTGMAVEWRISADGHGAWVTLRHRFRARLPLLAPLYEWVVEHMFIEHIAGRTLRAFKRLAEAAGAEGGP